MKFLFVLIGFLSALPGSSQSSDRSFITNPGSIIDSGTVRENVSAAAMSTFNRMFKDAGHVKWHATDNGSTVKFDRDNIKYHVFFNKKGRWQSTIQQLPLDVVPLWVAGRVKSDFRGFTIFFAQCVKTPVGSAYFVKIKKGNDWKSVSITTMATQVLGEYVSN